MWKCMPFGVENFKVYMYLFVIWSSCPEDFCIQFNILSNCPCLKVKTDKNQMSLGEFCFLTVSSEVFGNPTFRVELLLLKSLSCLCYTKLQFRKGTKNFHGDKSLNVAILPRNPGSGT